MKNLCLLMLMVSIFSSCVGQSGNSGHMKAYTIASTEAEWIRNGDPISFEKELWYPQDGVESFVDSEMILLGNYKGVQFFADKVDVRPYVRIYTKFSRNTFRYYRKTKNI